MIEGGRLEQGADIRLQAVLGRRQLSPMGGTGSFWISLNWLQLTDHKEMEASPCLS